MKDNSAMKIQNIVFCPDDYTEIKLSGETNTVATSVQKKAFTISDVTQIFICKFL